MDVSCRVNFGKTALGIAA